MFLRILCTFALVVVWSASAEPPSNSYGVPQGAPISSYGTPNYNANHDHHEYGEPKSYEFGYQVKDDYSGNNYNRQESSDGNQVRGEYRVQLPDGRTQIVTYYADWQTGFHADVRYEGEAHYPDQYNNNNNNNYGYGNGPSNQYGPPQLSAPPTPNYSYQNGNYNNNNNHHNNNGGSGGYNYNSAPATSSVSIKDYSNNNNANNYNNHNNNGGGGGYDSYSNGFGNKARPGYEYGAP